MIKNILAFLTLQSTQAFIPNYSFQTYTRPNLRNTYFKKHINNDNDEEIITILKQQELIKRDYTLAKPPDEHSLLPQNLKKGSRIIAFGDVHGDVEALRDFLIVAGILDPNSSNEHPVWNKECKDTIVVQTGDILDRYHNELECIRMLCKLSHQALQYDSSIICLLGNHEIKNCIGAFEYTTDQANAEFEGVFGEYLDRSYSSKWRVQYANNQPTRWNVCEPGNGLLSQNVLSNMKVAIVVGKSLFVHAGVTKEHLLHYNNSIAQMNEDANQWITSLHHSENNHEGEFETIDHILASVQRRMNYAIDNLPYCVSGSVGSASPIWMRDYSMPANASPSSSKQKMIEDALHQIGNGVERIVMGHTVQENINVALKGRAFRIDVGASRGIKGGRVEVLEIIHNGEDEDCTIHVLGEGGRIPVQDRHVLDYDF